MPARHSKKGFTLIELLVVIGILAILLTIVLIAINPSRQFAQANNTKRRSDVLAILNAIHEYAADNQGNLPTAMQSLTAGTQYEIAATGTTGFTNIADICQDVMPKYLSAFPTDPKLNVAPVTACNTAGGDAYDSGYEVEIDANNRVTVTAPLTDTTVESSGNAISITR